MVRTASLIGMALCAVGLFASVGNPGASPAQRSQTTLGFYDLVFLDPYTRLEVTSEPFGSPVVLHAHVADSGGNPAVRGDVVFQYCSLTGRPANDINRVDEAPLEECEAGNASWAGLARVSVNALGDAEYPFCCPRITPVIGFRYTFMGNFNWGP
jgi:hypothetical protein